MRSRPGPFCQGHTHTVEPIRVGMRQEEAGIPVEPKIPGSGMQRVTMEEGWNESSDEQAVSR